jgi:hypothetical protein
MTLFPIRAAAVQIVLRLNSDIAAFRCSFGRDGKNAVVRQRKSYQAYAWSVGLIEDRRHRRRNK